MALLGKEIHRRIYLLGICVLAASIPLSRYFMSVAQFILLINWILEGNLKSKLRLFFSNKPAVIFSSIYLLHILGLFVTTDWDYAIKDLRTKIPVLLLPLIFASSGTLHRNPVKWILISYLMAVFAGTVNGFFILTQHHITDLRELSPHISHIRFSLNVCMAIILLVACTQNKAIRNDTAKMILTCSLLLWFAVYLYVSQSFTGYYVIAVLAFLGLVIRTIRERNKYLKTIMLLVVFLMTLALFLYLRGEYRSFFQGRQVVKQEKLACLTPSAHWYSHDTMNFDVISGNRVWLYVSKEEMRSLWNTRSSIPYDSLSNNGLRIEDLLIRYLTSKGLRKDSGGVSNLTPEDIHFIENGVADNEETHGSPIHKRLRKIFWEYQNYLSTGDPSGHSFMMRLEYWKASLTLIKDHPLTGVGTGDMNIAFEEYYNNHHSKLKPEWRRRSHNQFLSVAVGFGIIGLLWFLIALFYPPVKMHKRHSFIFVAFFILLFLSMLPEDTLESQEGVTFAAFFFSFLLFAVDEKETIFENHHRKSLNNDDSKNH